MTAAELPGRAPVLTVTGPHAVGRTVICPACQETITWDDNPRQVHEWIPSEGRYRALDLGSVSESRRSLKLAESYVPCPHQLPGQTEQHYLPATYHRNGRPITIGVVGRALAGKTHLLVAMLRELLRNAGTDFGLMDVQPIDQRQHARFEQQFLRPFGEGRALAGTAATADGVQLYLEAIQVRTDRGPRTISFFDIAGEEFAGHRGVKDSEFLIAVDAVLYVEAVDDIGMANNDAITGARRVLDHNTAGTAIPAAVVLTKADRERFTEPLDRWLREPVPDRPWSAGFDEESRDVYAWLYRNEATYLLGLFESYERCTLHVASATGGAADVDNKFPRGVRPVRVLEPLVALLDAIGVLGTGNSR